VASRPVNDTIEASSSSEVVSS